MGSFVAIDVETANAFMGSICQIGLVRFEGGKEVGRRSWLIDPGESFSPVNVRIHGIDERTVRGMPSFAERHPELAEFTSNAITVSHTHFDRVAVAQACANHGVGQLVCRWLDSARVARRAWPQVARQGYGLAALAERLGITFRHHDAVEDAWAAGVILQRAIEETAVPLEAWFDRVRRPISLDGNASVARAGGEEGPLVGETFVFTGALSMPRREAADRASSLGARVTPTVTAETTVLVVGDQDLSKLGGKAKSSKHLKAEKLMAEGRSIRIMAESDFVSIDEIIPSFHQCEVSDERAQRGFEVG